MILQEDDITGLGHIYTSSKHGSTQSQPVSENPGKEGHGQTVGLLQGIWEITCIVLERRTPSLRSISNGSYFNKI